MKKNFTFCYDNATGYSHSTIKLNGYYVNIEPFERVQYDNKTGTKISSVIDTIYNNILFFSDGVVVIGFGGLNCGNCEIQSNNQFLSDISQNKPEEAESFYNGFNWGIYKIDRDTVKLQVVNHPPKFNPYWHLFEYWYLINKDGTLQPIYSKNLIDGRLSKKNQRHPQTYQFIETNLHLKSNTWLKREKWFWCDEKQIIRNINNKL
ncbi:MAG TPA: hypothetical protein PKX92_14205 [Edaphocola sp.]|nr:hypothetical protein [Edaphocola sp.]